MILCDTGVPAAFRQLILNRFFMPASDPQLVEKILAIMMATPSHVAVNAMRGINGFNALPVAAQCRVRALHLAAGTPLNPPHLMSEWLPDVVNGWTVGSGHFSQLEVPDQVNGMIEGFLRHYV